MSKPFSFSMSDFYDKELVKQSLEKFGVKTDPVTDKQPAPKKTLVLGREWEGKDFCQRILKSGNRTIVFWADGTKTIVKRSEDEDDNCYSAFTAALGIKLVGSNSALKRMILKKTEFQAPKKQTECTDTCTIDFDAIERNLAAAKAAQTADEAGRRMMDALNGKKPADVLEDLNRLVSDKDGLFGKMGITADGPADQVEQIREGAIHDG